MPSITSLSSTRGLSAPDRSCYSPLAAYGDACCGAGAGLGWLQAVQSSLSAEAEQGQCPLAQTSGQRVLAVLTAAAHLPGHRPIFPARYAEAGQQQGNTELSSPFASPQTRKVLRPPFPHVEGVHKHERPPAEQLHERGVAVQLQAQLLPPGSGV